MVARKESWKSELPTDENQCAEIEKYQDGIFEEHVEGWHDATLHLLYITTHASYDVTLSLLAEEPQREGSNLLIKLVANVSYDTSPYRDDGGWREKISRSLQEGHEGEEQADDQEGGRRTMCHDELLDIIIQIVGGYLLDGAPVAIQVM